MGCFDGLARVLLVVINIVFMLAGLSFFIVGLILRYGKSIYEPFLETGITHLEKVVKDTGLAVLRVDDINLGEVMTGLTTGLIIGGLAIAALSFVGCCGASCEVSFMLGLYAIALIVFFVGEVVAIGLLYGKPDLVTDELKDSLSEYKGVASSEVFSLAWNIVMIQFQCCGVDSYHDFSYATSWNNNPKHGVTLDTPVACCKTLPKGGSEADFRCATSYSAATNNGKTGCYQTLWGMSLANTAMIVPVLVACGIIQIAFILFAIVVARSTEK